MLLSIPELPIGPSINRFVRELAASLDENGLILVTHLMAAHGRPLVEVCAALDVSAVLGFDAFDQETVDSLYRLGVSVVLPEGVDRVHLMTQAGRMQAEYLIARGHRRIGYALPDHPGLQPMAQERLRGTAEACAFHDETAMGVLAGLRQLGLEAPGALAVIGADDIPTARVAAPPLTTIRFDLRESA